MTKNQIELIKARETERSNRAQEELAAQGHKVGVAQSVLRGLATSLIPKGDTILSLVDRHATKTNHNQFYPAANTRRRGDLS